MRSIFAALRRLPLPWGKTSGTRLLLDGVEGRVVVYADNDAETALLDNEGLLTRAEFDPAVWAALGSGELRLGSLLTGAAADEIGGRVRMSAEDDGDPNARNVLLLGGYQLGTISEMRIGIVSPTADGTDTPRVEMYSSTADPVELHLYGDAHKIGSGGVEEWTPLNLINGWSARAGWHVPSIRLNVLGHAELRGGMQGGNTTSGTVLATVDAKYRPQSNVTIPIATNNGYCALLECQPDGDLLFVRNATAPAITSLFLSGSYTRD